MFYCLNFWHFGSWQMVLPCSYALVDVMTNVWWTYVMSNIGRCCLPYDYYFVFGDCDLRLMLLPIIAVADVIATWQMVSH